MSQDNPYYGTLIVAGAGFLGAVLGSIVRPILDWLLQGRRLKKEQTRHLLQQKMAELYRPLYEKVVIMPDSDPEHYFSEWDDEEFHGWLSDALAIILPKLHLAEDDLLERVQGMRETAVNLGYDAEPDVHWLYTHIQEQFTRLREALG